MKFVVDEMPYWHTDCPFYDDVIGQCKIDRDHCAYMDAYAGKRDAEDCLWLTPKNE